MSIEKIKGSKIEGFSGSANFANSLNNRNRIYLDSGHDTTNFTGAATAKTASTLGEFLREIMPKSIQKMLDIHEGMGEVQNQLINAVGTGMVAPVFIKYNPISDTDKDTRTYTAWRQPVSAVLAVCTQAAIVVPFNSLIKKLADVGFLPTRYNSTLFPSDDFVKAQIIAADPSKKHLSKDEMKKEIKEYNKVHYENPLKNMIENDNKIVFATTNGKVNSKFEMPKEEFKNLFIETIDNIIKDEQQELEKVINKKLPKKLQRAIFFNQHPEESREVLTRLGDTLNELLTRSDFDMDPKSFIAANKEFKKECTTLIKEIKKDPARKAIRDELVGIVKELKNKIINSDTSTLRILQDKVTKMQSDVNRMEAMSDTKSIRAYVSEIIDRRTDAIDGTIKPLQEIKEKLINGDLTVKEAQEIINDAISRSEASVREELKTFGLEEKDIKGRIEWIESSGTRLKGKASSIAKCIGNTLKKHAKSNIDGFKRWTGLVVSLAILPVTCWLLNRIYPWFMDLAFPKLSNKAAAAKEKKNQQKVEVK